jgi:signal transduction histidine kinase
MKRRTRPRSWRLSTRLALRLAAVMVAAIALAAAAVAWRTIATIRELDDTALQNQARAIAMHLGAGPDGALRLDLPPALEAAFQSSDGNNLYLICDPQNRPLAGSDPGQADLLLPFLPPPGADGFFRAPPSDAHPHGMVGLLTIARPWRIVVAQGREQSEVLVDSLVQEFMVSALWLLVPIGLVTVAIAVFTIHRGLWPLRRTSAAAALVGPTRPGVRLPSARLPRELVPLVATVNRALDRLEQGLDSQRRFVGEAAHALRTPLAVLTARLDALPDGPETAALRHDADRMSRLVGQMLRMARLEGLPLDTSRAVDLHAAAVEAISALAPLGLAREVQLALTEGPRHERVEGNHAALVLALTNLIENALAHAPPNTTVEVEIAAPATIRVLDRGPGVPEDQRAAIFERFRRGGGERTEGAGLGLAIVAQIAAAHRGSVRVAGREGGGAVFILDLGPALLPVPEA